MSALSHDMGGDRSEQSEHADLLQALAPQIVAIQVTWHPEVAVRRFPYGYTHLWGPTNRPGTGHPISLHWDVVDPEAPPAVKHDCRVWLASTWISPLLSNCFVASVVDAVAPVQHPLPALQPSSLGHLAGLPPPVVVGVASRLCQWLTGDWGLVS